MEGYQHVEGYMPGMHIFKLGETIALEEGGKEVHYLVLELKKNGYNDVAAVRLKNVDTGLEVELWPAWRKSNITDLYDKYKQSQLVSAEKK